MISSMARQLVRHWVSGLIALLLVLLVACGAASKPAAKPAEAPKAAPAAAQFNLKLLCINRTLQPCAILWPEFAKGVEERTKGQVKIQMLSYPEAGLTGFEFLRVIKPGTVQMGEMYGGFVGGDFPLAEGVEMLGMFPDAATQIKAIKEYKPVEAKLLEERFNAKLLNVVVYPSQAIFSKVPLEKPEDFKKLKIRAYSVPTNILFTGLGAEAVTMAFADVYGALERGVLNSGLTGTDPGYGQRWYEVTKYIHCCISARPHVALLINKDIWNSIPPESQKIMQEEADKIEQKNFELIAQWDTDGLRKNIEKGMIEKPLTPEMIEAIRKVVREQVIPKWIERTGGPNGEGVKYFNEIISPHVGFALGR
jgi:TRAP-type C4-dicarboxylate transport system substrate-binding protein